MSEYEVSFEQIQLEKVIAVTPNQLSKAETDQFENLLRVRNYSSFPYENSVYVGGQYWCLYLSNDSLYAYEDLSIYYDANKSHIPHVDLTNEILEEITLKTTIGFTFAEALKQIVIEYLTNKKGE